MGCTLHYWHRFTSLSHLPALNFRAITRPLGRTPRAGFDAPARTCLAAQGGEPEETDGNKVTLNISLLWIYEFWILKKETGLGVHYNWIHLGCVYIMNVFCWAYSLQRKLHDTSWNTTKRACIDIIATLETEFYKNSWHTLRTEIV